MASPETGYQMNSRAAELPLAALTQTAHEHLTGAFRTATSEPSTFRFPFITIRATFHTPGYAELCARAFWQGTTTDEPTEPIEIVVTDAETEPHFALRIEANRQITADELIATFERGNLDGYLDVDYHNWHLYNRQHKRGLLVLGKQCGWAPWEASLPLRQFLHWAYQARGMRLMHAASLGVNNEGVLLIGSGGAGKSGTTLSGIRHGMSTVGDDYVVVRQDASGVRAYPLTRLMKQDPRGVTRVGIHELSNSEVLNWQGKYEFAAEDVAPGCMVSRLNIRALLLPHITGATKTRIIPARASEAMMALTPSNLGQLPGRMADGFRFLSQLCSRLPAYHVELGSDPQEIADTLRIWLERNAV